MNPFLVGFVVGATIGVASVALGARRSGPSLRQQISSRVQGALSIARQVSAQREQELWAEWRAQLPHAQPPALLAVSDAPPPPQPQIGDSSR